MLMGKSQRFLVCSCCVVIGLFVLLDIRRTHEAAHTDPLAPFAWQLERWRGSEETRRCKPRICGNVLRDSDGGSWVPLSNLKTSDYESRLAMDRQIRVRQNWPANLFRADKRCGPGHLVEGYRLQSLCDPHGDAPCCNPSTGYCGRTDEHCQCANCTDLRTMRSAELVRWLPSNSKCTVKNFTRQDACSLLNANVRSLTFIGDSLLRHVFTSTLVVLTGDEQWGGLALNTTRDDREACSGEFQIVDKRCSVEIAAQSGSSLAPGALCAGLATFTIDNIQDYLPYLNSEVDAVVRGLLGKADSYLVMGCGMHYQLEAERMLDTFLRPITRLILEQGRGWPRIIWVEIHGLSGFLRIDTDIHNTKIARFNRRVNRFLEDRGIPIVRTFEMSRDLLSYDGRHYGAGFNRLKAQLLLNYFEETFERCAS